MKDIKKILKAYKLGKLSERQLFNFLNIKKRSKPYWVDLGNNEGFQVWSENTCLLIAEKKEVAKNFILNHNKLLTTITK